MERREFLSAFKTKQQAEAITIEQPFEVSRTSSTLAPYTGPFTQNEIIHLLKRTMFGSSLADVNYFKTKTVTQAIDELVNAVSPLPAPPVKEYDTTGAITQPDTNIAVGTTWVNDVNNDGTIQGRRRASFKKWWMGNMINQDRSIREKMIMFWHNHFSTETGDVGNAQFVYKHHALLRSNSLGNFKALVKAVTIDPAMLIYLNGQLNTASAPDENYARELQELFCCGKGPASLYTENDVKEAAKVLTGWRNNPATINSYFDSTRHNSNNKTFSSFYGNTIITGRMGATAGNLELDDLLTMIFNAQEVSKFICRRLYRWFIYYEIDANVEANIITPLAVIFKNSNYEIKPVLSALLKSEHFFDVLNQGCFIKSPVDLIVGMSREYSLQFPAASDYLSNYALWNGLYNYAVTMQQNIGDPPDVSGWKAYYQIPQFQEIWINSDTLPKRNQFTDTMALTGFSANGKRILIDGPEFVKQLPNPSNPDALIDDVIKTIFRMPLSVTAKAQLKKDILLGGQTSDYYWSDVWNLYISNPGNASNTNIVRTRLRDLLKYFMGLAEYQLI